MKILLLLLVAAGAALAVRLVSLQVSRAEEYRQVLESGKQVILRPIPAKRGSILARKAGGGTVVLVEDQPAFELGVFYPVMDPDVEKNEPGWYKDEIRRLQKQIKSKDPNAKPDKAQLHAQLNERIRTFWDQIAQISELSPDEIQARRSRIVQLVQRIRDEVQRRHGELEYPILEQRMFHPILTDLDEAAKLKIEFALDDDTWAQIVPSTRRVFFPGETDERNRQTLCHILGQARREPGAMPKVYAKLDDILDEARLDDDYLPGELRGVSGLEQAYEDSLKGQRGWAILTDPPQPMDGQQRRDGQDIVLTINTDLQREAERLLRQAVASLDYALAGAAVVLDMRDQSLLALASVPTYDPSRYYTDYEKLADDYRHLSLLNRALMAQQPPGSIVKPVVAEIALCRGAIDTTQHYSCSGKLFENRSEFRCWKNPPGHGDLDLPEAISQSCDVYFYHVGEQMGAETLADGYRLFGLGQSPLGLKLPCATGTVPDGDWFKRHHGRAMSDGDARNLAIGQGDLLVTPLQAAIMVSTLLTGELRPVRLVESDPAGESRSTNLGQTGLSLIRDGMDRVINGNGTGKYARDEQDRVHLAGKSGSAEVGPQIRWRITYADKHTQSVEPSDKDRFIIALKGAGAHVETPEETLDPASNQVCWTITYREVHAEIVASWEKDDFLQDLKAREDVTDIEPPEKIVYPILKPEDRGTETRSNGLAHAWFIGYAPAENPRVVITIFIEYGQSGGPAAGPVFRDIALKCKELGYLW